MAETAPEHNLDLSSTERTVTMDHHPGFESATINVGGTPRTVQPGDLLTPAEHAALHQVLTTGQQTINLGVLGNAVGGTLHITPDVASTISNLVVPQGVTAVRDFGAHADLNVLGNLTNAGNFFGVSTNTQVNNAIINANNIFNQAGGLLSTVLPAGGLPGVASALTTLDLTLNAVHDIVNAGVISSSGNLTANAGGSIINALPAGMTGATPVMQAAGALNLISGAGNIVNSGLISSLTNNINIATQTVQNLLINAVGGRFEALAGAINIRDALFADKADLTMTGGDYLSRELNLNSGTGDIMAELKNVTGTVNANAHVLHLFADGPTLTLGTLKLTGDPLMTNQNGDIVITSDLIFLGQDLALVAGGSIFTGDADPDTVIDITTAGNPGGDITLVAGAFFTFNGGNVEITGPSCLGGDIDLTGASVTNGDPLGEIDARGTAGGAGGNVTMVAFPGAFGAGRILLPSLSFVQTGGDTGGNAGDVTIISGTPSGFIPSPNSINLGNVNTSNSGSSAVGTGTITIATATPDITGGDGNCDPCVVIDSNGTLTDGAFDVGDTQDMSISTDLLATNGADINVTAGVDAVINGDVQSSAATAGGAGDINITAGRNVFVNGSLLARGNAGDGGQITVSTNSSVDFQTGPFATVNGVTGIIRADVLAGAGNGGGVDITNGGTGGINIPLGTDIGVFAGGGGGNGGAIVLTADEGPIRIGFGTLAADAVGTGAGSFNGGQITLEAQSFNLPSAITLSANGADSGDGGTISVTSTNANADLEVGDDAGEFTISAISGSLDGNGGNVTLSSGRELNIDVAFLSANPDAGGNGNGAIFNFTAGTANSTLGNLDIFDSTAPLDPGLFADGVGTGQGGAITLTSNSVLPFIVGENTDNGVEGRVTANGGATGSGGTVTINANGSGRLVISDDPTDPTIEAKGGTTTAGTSGTIILNSSSLFGIDVQDTADLDVSITQGSGGNITLNAVNGPLTIPFGTLAANGVDNGGGGAFDGGTVSITALALNVTGVGSLDLQANGDDTGDGGNVTVNITGAIPNLAADPDVNTLVVDDDVNGGITISAMSGGNGGNGGIVSVSSGRNLEVDPDDVTAGPQGTDGNGAQLTFSAGTAVPGTLLILDDLFADGTGIGDGGSITLNVDSNFEFQIRDSLLNVNGVRGMLSANAGGGGGDGGTVSVTNSGFGGINVFDTSLISADAVGGTTAGVGGTIILDAGSGKLTIDDSSNAGFDVDAAGTGDNQGGTVTLIGTAIQVLNGSVSILARGINAGPGGTVTITNEGVDDSGLADLIIDGVSNGFEISATSGASGGNGGQVTLSTGRALIISLGNLTAGVVSGDGNGPVFNFTAGTAMLGRVALFDVADLDASAGDNGAGGTINIIMNSNLPFTINDGFPQNGINGELIARGGSTSGDGGSVTVQNNGTGGILLNQASSIDVTATDGAGGSIALIAPSGKLEIDIGTSGTLDASATGAGPFDGGNITLTAQEISITNAGANWLQLLANSGDSGNGGTVSVTASAPLSDLDIGTDAGEIEIQATGGTGGAGNDGDGGTVNLTAGRTVFVNLNDDNGPGIVATPQGDNGDGANYNFTAGLDVIVEGADLDAAAVGDGAGGTVNLTAGNVVFVENNILAFGSGTGGDGGTITLSANSVETFFIAPVILNNSGVQGMLDVSAGTDGDAGSISVTNNGLGGVAIDDLGDLVLSVTDGAGGNVTLASANGPIVIGGGTLNVDGVGGSAAGEFAGGTITFTGRLVDFDTSGGPIMMSANGSSGGDGAGGTIAITAEAINISGGDNVSLSANGTGEQNGGTVTLNATGSNSGLDIGTGPDQFMISATGGATAGNGGTVNLTTGVFIFVDMDGGALVADPLGNGKGAQLSFTVTNSSPCCGNLFVLGDLKADGIGSGDGGNITISVNSFMPFSIGEEDTANGVTGSISANGDALGDEAANGGTITITNNGTGGVRFADILGLITANAAGGGGSGGTISVTTGSGGLITEGPVLAANATCGTGGTISLNMASLEVLDGNPAAIIFANGAGGFAGGTVNLTLSSATQDLVIGTGSGQFEIEATGGELDPGLAVPRNSMTGGGGTVNLQSGRNLTVNMGSLDVDPIGDSGDGANLSFTAAGTVVVNGSLDVSGRSTPPSQAFAALADGGSVTISSGSKTKFTVNSGNTKNGVTGTIAAEGGPNGGQGGAISITLTNPKSVAQFPGGFTLSVDAQPTTDEMLELDGGTITLSAGSVKTTGQLPPFELRLWASGADFGDAGTVNVTLTGKKGLTVGSGRGQLAVRAQGGEKGGSGGTVNLTAQGKVTVNTGNLEVNPDPLGALNVNGNGANLNFTSLVNSVFVNSGLDLSGAGRADGGLLTIQSPGSTQFVIGAGASSAGVNGNISAQGGPDGGDGGSVSITVGGGLTTTSIRFRPGATINVDATPDSDPTLAFTGGTITLSAAGSVSVDDDTLPATLSANGAGLGDGGSVTVSGPGGNITIGNGSQQITVSATGGTLGMLAGDGGAVTISGRDVTVNPAFLTVGPLGDRGDGASITLTAMNRLFVNGTLSADAASDYGDGGTIQLTSNSGNEFFVGVGAVQNGVNGLIQARGATGVAGNGGQVTIINNGTGGITFAAVQSLFVNPNTSTVGGDGGQVTVTSQRGEVTFEGAGLDGNAAVHGDGGQVTVTAERFVLPGLAAVALTANGAGLGDGGQVNVSTVGTGSNSAITLNTVAGTLRVSATGGTGGVNPSLSGDGGSVTVSSARDLSVFDLDGLGTDSIMVNPLGLNGTGGIVNLNAGGVTAPDLSVTQGALFINGDLVVNGRGVSDGGAVILTSRSNQEFVVNGPGPNAITGEIHARAAGSAGNGGQVTITNSGSGGIEFGDQAIFVDPSATNGGNGGQITISASAGNADVVFTQSGEILVADARRGQVGTLFGRAPFNGGQISVTAGRGIVGAPGDEVEFTAFGVNAGTGGTISMTTQGSSSSSDITIGNDPGEFELEAFVLGFGSIGVATGGTVNVTAGRDLTVDPDAIEVFGINAPNFNGGTVNLTAGGNALASGRLFIQSSIGVDAGGVGDGGNITLTSRSGNRFEIFTGAAQNGVNGSVSASADQAVGAAQGDGGSITVNNLGTGGIMFDATPEDNILVSASPNGGAGGQISLASALGRIEFGGGSLNASAIGDFDGGSITLSSAQLRLPDGANVGFFANGASTGDGGAISVTVTDLGANLDIGTGNGEISFDVRGGTQFDGDGGSINVSVGGRLRVFDGNALQVAESFMKGGAISLTGGRMEINDFINAGFGGDDSISLTVSTTGVLQQTAGTLTANTIALTNNAITGGGIGTSDAPILVDANNLIVVTTSGNAFIDEDNQVILGASSAGGTLSLTVGGTILMDANVSASVLTVVTDNDGDIVVSGNLATPTSTKGAFQGTITLDADGDGSILQTTGQMGAKTINLFSDSGDIGLLRSRLVLTSGSTKTSLNLFALTGGLDSNVSIRTLSPVTIRAGAAGDTFEVIACGNLTVQSPVNAMNVFLGTSVGATGSVSVNNVITATDTIALFLQGVGQIKASGLLDAGTRVVLFADDANPDVNGGAQISSALVDTPNLEVFAPEAGSNATVTSVGNIDLDAEEAGDPAVVVGGTFQLTTQTNGNITITDDVIGSQVGSVTRLTANGAGTITSTGGTIISPNANLSSGTGLIDVDTDVGTLTASTQGNVTIEEQDDIIISSLTAGAGQANLTTVTSDADLTLRKVAVKGDFTAVADADANNTGNLLVEANAKVNITDGDINISNQNVASGTIFIGNKATVKAVSTLAGEGDVFIFIGAAPGGGAGVAPPNVTIVETNGGDVRFGTVTLGQSITANAPTNTLTAKAAVLQFDHDGSALGAAAIVLNGKVKITADPVLPGTGPVAKPSLVVPVIATPEAIVEPAPASSGMLVAPSVSVPAGSTIRGLDTLPSVRSGVETSEGTDLQPVAYVAPAPHPGVVDAVVATARYGGTVVKHSGADVRQEDDGAVRLVDGEALVAASRGAVVRAGRHYTVTVAAGAMALVSQHNGVFKVRSVYEGLRSPIRVLVDGRSVTLSAGQELIVSRSHEALQQAISEDNVGRRAVKSFVVDREFQVARCDISLVSLLQKSDLLARLVKSASGEDRSLSAKLMKMAACLMQTTSGRGAYSVADLKKLTSQELSTPRRFNTVADARM